MDIKLESLTEVVDYLFHQYDEISTLEVKTELRQREPNVIWNQKEVSDMMHKMYEDGDLSFTDNGTHRIYTKTSPFKIPTAY